LLTRLDETATYDGQTHPLFSNRWSGGRVEPAGYRALERFHLEGTTPVWSYAFEDALLEKRVWMEPGANTTYVRYHLRRGAAPLTLSVKAIVSHRDHHGNMRAGDWQPEIELVPRGLRVGADLRLLGAGAAVTAASEWYRGYWLAQEAYRGLAHRPLCQRPPEGLWRPHPGAILPRATARPSVWWVCRQHQRDL
jgi:hypothetical protein